MDSQANAHMAAKMQAYTDSLSTPEPLPRPDYSPDPSPMALPDEHRFMVIVGMPFIFGRGLDCAVEWGVACTGCKDRKPTAQEKPTEAGRTIRYNQVKLYSKKDFLDHFTKCPYARNVFLRAYPSCFTPLGERFTALPDDNKCLCAAVFKDRKILMLHPDMEWTPCVTFHNMHQQSIFNL